MKKYILLILVLFQTILIFAQTPEFQFTLYAEDFFGNRDSVVIGYDSTATDFNGWDPQFGEVDITNVPFDSVFELRASVDNSTNLQYPHQAYQTKVEIAQWQCHNRQLPYDARLHLSVRTILILLAIDYNLSYLVISKRQNDYLSIA